MKSPVWAALLLLGSAVSAWAVERPAFDPQIGAQLDLGLQLLDASGTKQSLANILSGRPALVVFGYDKCPNLCGVTQQAVASDLKKAGLDPADYRALFISIDKTETAQDAANAKEVVAQSTTPAGLKAWRFLTSADDAGASLAAEAGIHFDTRPRVDQFVHPIAILALTPEGRISRVLPALTFEPRDLRLALVEASANKLGSIADHVFLLCAGFDTSKGQYTAPIWAALKFGGITTILVLGTGILLLTRRRG
uniref:SCO family protein n=1 Tax=Mesorhizobium sp. WSM4875 TaxID=3038539 RepID=UPI0024160DCF|nr:SCO family protein [Mesorhizobium sp. WSM4875]WIE94690.1 SCO family protein [Mesorhizobium sp. WSM4875]